MLMIFLKMTLSLVGIFYLVFLAEEFIKSLTYYYSDFSLIIISQILDFFAEASNCFVVLDALHQLIKEVRNND